MKKLSHSLRKVLIRGRYFLIQISGCFADYPGDNYSNFTDDSSYYDYEDNSYYDNGYNNWDNGRSQWYGEGNGMEGYSQDYFQLTSEFTAQKDFGYYNEVAAGTVLDGGYDYNAQTTSMAAMNPDELKQMIRYQM